MTTSKKSDALLFQFAVIADSHLRLPTAVNEGGYASNRLTVKRTEYVIECVNKLRPAFVVHLGDLVHPIPALRHHEETVKAACDLFSGIDMPFYALPGNHDIGDKPNAWLPAPVVEENSHLVFADYWGALFQSFTVQHCRFICLDTSIMNSGFAREKEQCRWLENELHLAQAQGQRIFILTHYPLFICSPDEPTHYDNIDNPARGWLLALFESYHVEAVFSGHVHNPFIGLHKNTTYYTVPSISFVRPEYAELATVTPADEYGRNDTAKLGFFLVRVYADQHQILPVRTYDAGKLPAGMPLIEPYRLIAPLAYMMGVSLRRGWGRRIELAADGLDEFTRKEAHRDALLLALLELGVTALRVPFADLANVDVRQRLSDFVQLGFTFTIYTLGQPDESVLATMAAHGHLAVNWEMIFPEHAVSQIETAVIQARRVFSGQLFIAPVVPIKEADGDGSAFQHFAAHGFSSKQAEKAEQWLSMIREQPAAIGVTFRVSPWDNPADTLREIDRQSGRRKLINLQLPRMDEGVSFEDNDTFDDTQDGRLATFLVNAYAAGKQMTNTMLFIDTFLDSDRGYYPRKGLLDRRFNPNPAFYALKSVTPG